MRLRIIGHPAPMPPNAILPIGESRLKPACSSVIFVPDHRPDISGRPPFREQFRFGQRFPDFRGRKINMFFKLDNPWFRHFIAPQSEISAVSIIFYNIVRADRPGQFPVFFIENEYAINYRNVL
jgi:hypothetical protein